MPSDSRRAARCRTISRLPGPLQLILPRVVLFYFILFLFPSVPLGGCVFLGGVSICRNRTPDSQSNVPPFTLTQVPAEMKVAATDTGPLLLYTVKGGSRLCPNKKDVVCELLTLIFEKELISFIVYLEA